MSRQSSDIPLEATSLTVNGTAVTATAAEINTACDGITATAAELNTLDGVLSGSATWDPGSIADGNEEAKEITVTGAALGDYCICSFSLDVADLVLRGAVTAADTVTAILANNTGGNIDLSSGTVRALVIPQ